MRRLISLVCCTAFLLVIGATAYAQEEATTAAGAVAAAADDAAVVEALEGAYWRELHNDTLTITGEADGSFSLSHATLSYTRFFALDNRLGLGATVSPRSYRAIRLSNLQALREDIGLHGTYRISPHVSATVAVLHGSGERCLIDAVAGCDWRDFGVFVGRVALNVRMPLRRGIDAHFSVGRQGEWDRDPIIGFAKRGTSIRYGLAYSF